MNANRSTIPEFEEEPSVTPLSLRDHFLVRPLLRVLVSTLLAIFLIAILVVSVRAASWLASVITTFSSPKGPVVVASDDLVPYQRLQQGSIELGQVNQAVDGMVLTDTTPLLTQTIVLQAINKGDALTAESIITFPTTVILTDTVILPIPLPADSTIVPALQPGLPVFVIGTMISETMVYSTTAPLVDVTDNTAIVAVQPDVATRLSLYHPPRGQLLLLPTTDR